MIKDAKLKDLETPRELHEIDCEDQLSKLATDEDVISILISLAMASGLRKNELFKAVITVYDENSVLVNGLSKRVTNTSAIIKVLVNA